MNKYFSFSVTVGHMGQMFQAPPVTSGDNISRGEILYKLSAETSRKLLWKIFFPLSGLELETGQSPGGANGRKSPTSP